MPARSFIPDAPPVIVAVYTAEFDNADDGVRVIVPVEVLTVAGTTMLEAFFNWNVVVVTVDAFTASLKVADTVVFTATPVDPFKGDTDDTVGGVLSAIAAVVKDQV